MIWSLNRITQSRVIYKWKSSIWVRSKDIRETWSKKLNLPWLKRNSINLKKLVKIMPNRLTLYHSKRENLNQPKEEEYKMIDFKLERCQVITCSRFHLSNINWRSWLAKVLVDKISFRFIWEGMDHCRVLQMILMLLFLTGEMDSNIVKIFKLIVLSLVMFNLILMILLELHTNKSN